MSKSSIVKRRNTKPKAIVLDYDDTVVDFIGGLCRLHNKKYGTCITANDIRDWNFNSLNVKDIDGKTVVGSQLQATFAEYEPEGLYVGLNMLEYAFSALEIMKQKGYVIIILTARSERYHKQTELNLIFNKIDLLVSRVYCKPCDWPGIEKFKVKRLKELSKEFNIVAFADDKLETVQQVNEFCNVANLFLVERGHNLDHEVDEKVIRVKNILEMLRYLKKVN